MAKLAVELHHISMRLVCVCFGISQTCYRYRPRLSDEDAEIADWLVRLTHNQLNWAFRRYFLYYGM